MTVHPTPEERLAELREAARVSLAAREHTIARQDLDPLSAALDQFMQTVNEGTELEVLHRLSLGHLDEGGEA